ncbi:alpha/beta fold hydrolase [Paraglaciecola sp. 2405UD69-4]|uniref:alpha/beta fold hydrolase n=1 Tax=Paraglaciecola sp. 2405UD69-4 TaxID=3391836 RepID=UPI0039C9C607
MSNSNVSPHLIDQPVIFYPGTLCDERIFTPCWQYLDIPKRAFVPLQWAQNLEHMQMLSNDRFDYFDEPVHLVGYSMGGYIAALSAIENKGRVASLTLIGSSCNALPEAAIKQRQHTLKLIQNKQFKGSTDKHIAKYFHEVNQDDELLKGIVTEMEEDLGSGVLEAHLIATGQRKNLLPQLSKCGFKTHFIVGEQDHLVNLEELKQSVGNLAFADLHIVQNAGHMVPLEQPQLLARNLINLIA